MVDFLMDLGTDIFSPYPHKGRNLPLVAFAETPSLQVLDAILKRQPREFMKGLDDYAKEPLQPARKTESILSRTRENPWSVFLRVKAQGPDDWDLDALRIEVLERIFDQLNTMPAEYSTIHYQVKVILSRVTKANPSLEPS
ncbi:hypothetical protein H072_3086 [Dactylellina haptotyla CBS 200.50]|uniref:Uncharacterized protein n=1 Tax=Dactylellina haptotyla (strain CBS 200.50) TaxID=1284197 RepID=S8AJ92_DACHA|nr:hypothetical protein H072_3086 [Dactylellina haptotyla CBS 200.50]